MHAVVVGLILENVVVGGAPSEEACRGGGVMCGLFVFLYMCTCILVTCFFVFESVFAVDK